MTDKLFRCIDCGTMTVRRPRPDVTYQLTPTLAVPYPADIAVVSCAGCGEVYTTQPEDEAIRDALLAEHAVPT